MKAKVENKKGKKTVKCNTAHSHDFNHVSSEVKLYGITVYSVISV